jgi:maleylacetate reductase
MPVMPRFVHQPDMPRVVFGSGALDSVSEEVARLTSRRVLLIVTSSARDVADRISAALGSQVVERIDGVAMHVPSDVANAAITQAVAARADLVLCVGGGSAVGLAKAVARETKLPILAVPTTYAGSEMTSIWGRTDDGHKVTGRDPAVLPRTVVYDPDLTLGLPPAVSAASGMNALAHAVEGLYASNATPITRLFATEGLGSLARALPEVVDNPADVSARAEALYGSWLCGWVLGATRMGLHHSICHVLGGRYDLSHAAVHSAVLPYVTAWNEPAAADAMADAAAALGVDAAGPGLWDLAQRLGAPTSLRPLDFRPEHIPEVAQRVAQAGPPNPREVTEDAVSAILGAAMKGSRPTPGLVG